MLSRRTIGTCSLKKISTNHYSTAAVYLRRIYDDFMWKPVSFRTELPSWVSWMKLTNKTGYVLLLKSNKKLNQNDMNLRCFSKGSHEGIWQNGITRRDFRDAPRFSWDKSGHSCFSRLVYPETNLVTLVSLDTFWLLSILSRSIWLP